MARPTILTRVDKDIQEQYAAIAKADKRPVQYFTELALIAYLEPKEANPVPASKAPQQLPAVAEKAKKKAFNAVKCMEGSPVINNIEWVKWATFRKSQRKPIGEQAARSQGEMLSKYSHEDQRLIIKSSLDNEYQGLFEPKGGSRSHEKRESVLEQAQREARDVYLRAEARENNRCSVVENGAPVQPQMDINGGETLNQGRDILGTRYPLGEENETFDF